MRSPGQSFARSWTRVVLFVEPTGLLWGLATNAATTGISFWVRPHVQLAHLMILHLLGAVLISTRFGPFVSTVTAITSVLAFDYFCIPPVFAFALPDRHSEVTFVGMLVTALTMSFLIQRLRYQRAAAIAAAARTLELCELSLDLSQATGASELPALAERHLDRLFGSPSSVLLDGATRERGDTWEAAGFVYRRLDRTPHVVRVPSGSNTLGPRPKRDLLLAACTDRIAVALERLHLSDTARRAHVEAETERLRNALLSSVSHDLRTPLSSILTAGTTLLGAEPLDGRRRPLLETIVQETERLNALVTNLLSVTRLESGDVQIQRTHEALDDLVHDVISRLTVRLEGRPVELDVSPDVPLVRMDPVLVDQVLVNLIENVLAYTPANSPLTVRVGRRADAVLVEVLDRGPGVDADESERVFEKFYRGRRGKIKHGGTGLGLTICRAVARIHGGTISLGPRPGGGTRVEFTLPCPDGPAAAGARSQDAELMAVSS